MTEELGNVFEQDISQLGRAIEEKRAQVEREAGIVADDEREMVRAAISEKSPRATISTATAHTTVQTTQKSYLDDLPQADQETMRSLLALVEEKGITEAIEQASMQSPYLLDVFHDELTDKVYDVLKARGYLS